MSPQAKRPALVAACGLLVTVLASRSFYFQELFFAFLLFAIVFLVLWLLAGLVVVVWMLYARAVVYLATRTVRQAQRTLPVFQAVVLWLAPMVTKSAGLASAGRWVLLHPLGGWLREGARSFRLEGSHFREDAQRAVKHLRLLLKQS
ncbi:MAG: hypothetical protein DMG40_14720 [Acidobacteria bacterium]|nr:MAG: hypothetical protein DMG40_14720 [Acidobacteriota bacterium]